MEKRPRGRTRVYDIPLSDILDAVRKKIQIRAAAEALGCPEHIIHYRLRYLGLTPWEVMQAGSIEELLVGRER